MDRSFLEKLITSLNSKRVAACLALTLVGAASGGIYVVPNINTAGNQAIPLGAAKRFQEIVGSGQFNGSLLITGIRFRSAVGTGPVNFKYTSFKVTLSTTQVYPNTSNGHALPSTTYAANAGPDAVTVYNGPISGSSPGCTGQGPCAFDMEIPFTSSFPFAPAQGRLLVDIVASSPTGTPAGSLDGVSFTDSTSSTVAVVSGDPTQAAGDVGLGGFVLGLETVTPLITGVQNSASNLPAGLPNAGIAQGAIFVVKGSGLGPANISIAPTAFQSTSLSGTSVAVTVAGTTVNAPMYYTSDGQIAALLPSNTPTGSGTLTVTYNKLTSGTATIQVVPSNVGIFTIDSSGQGPGIVTYADYSLVSAAPSTPCGGPNTSCGAANPGDTLVLWATGLGPVTGNDTSGAGLGSPINVPLTLWLGGVAITPSYQGRSGCCIGEDQIVFTVPKNVPTGCAVPLVVQIGSGSAVEISNTTVMPIASGSRSCTPSAPGIPANAEQTVANGPLMIGSLEVDHYSDGNGVFEDDAKAQFFKVTSYNPGSQPFFLSFVDDQPLGTCYIYNNLNENNDIPFASAVNLDAGATISLKGPNGSVSIPTNQDKATIGTGGKFLVPGSYTFTGTGGADVGAFNANLTIPTLPTLVSPLNNATVTRANGLTVNWTGGSGTVVLEVAGPTDSTYTNGVWAVCTAPASAGTFTIPPYVMEALPASSSNFSAGFAFSTEVEGSFTATGLSVGIVNLNRYNIAGSGYGWASGGFTLK